MQNLLDTAGTGNTGAAATLLEMIGASWMSQAICVAAELGLADLLTAGPKDIDELAQAVDCQPSSLHRLMRALVSIGLFSEHENEVFKLTTTGALLRSGGQPSVRSWAIWWGRHLWPVWENLGYSVKTNQSARKMMNGREGYQHIEAAPAVAMMFNQAMAELTQIIAGEVLRVYDFAGTKHLVDVGGGYGGLLTAILTAHPAMHGTLFDLSHAIAEASTHVAKAGIAQRCSLVAGSFFDAAPGNGDVYLLKSILHNWNDESSIAILRNCRRAMPKEAKLVLVERVMPARMTESGNSRAAARTDLNMLVGLGGRERTETEFVALLTASGFRTTALLQTTLDYSVIEGVPV